MDDSDSMNNIPNNLTSQILQSPITRPAQRQSLRQQQLPPQIVPSSPVKSTDPTPRKSVNVILSSDDFSNLSSKLATPIHAINANINSNHRSSNTRLPLANNNNNNNNNNSNNSNFNNHSIARTESGRLLPQIGQSKIPICTTSTVYIYY